MFDEIFKEIEKIIQEYCKNELKLEGSVHIVDYPICSRGKHSFTINCKIEYMGGYFFLPILVNFTSETVSVIC